MESSPDSVRDFVTVLKQYFAISKEITVLFHNPNKRGRIYCPSISENNDYTFHESFVSVLVR